MKSVAVVNSFCSFRETHLSASLLDARGSDAKQRVGGRHTAKQTSRRCNPFSLWQATGAVGSSAGSSFRVSLFTSAFLLLLAALAPPRLSSFKNSRGFFSGLPSFVGVSAGFPEEHLKQIPFSFTLSRSDCSVRPDPQVAADAKVYYLNCPSDVDSISLYFAQEKWSTPIYDSSYNQISELVHPLGSKGTISQEVVYSCEDADLKETCQKHELDFRRSSGAEPQLENIYLDRYPVTPQAFDPEKGTYDVALYSNEPVNLLVKAKPGYYVDFNPVEPEHGFVDTTASKVYRPASPAGESEQTNVYVTNKDHSAINVYTINIRTVQSLSPLLASVEPSVGRLDPKFKPHRYAYYVRVPDGSRSIGLTFIGVNDRDSRCTVLKDGLGEYAETVAFPLLNSGSSIASYFGDALGPETLSEGEGKQQGELQPISSEPLSFRGRGSVQVNMPSTTPGRSVLAVTCEDAENQNKIQYTFTFVDQKQGSTLLDDLSVSGATFDRSFDPTRAGPYLVNLPNPNNLKWVQFKCQPRNPLASCKIEGKSVDSETGLSPWFRVPAGEMRRFTAAVTTPLNNVAEQYYVDINRQAPWYQTTKFGTRFAEWVGWISSIMSLTSPVNFLQNAKFLHFISVTSRLNGLPESYDAYSYELNKWNLEWPWAKSASFVDRNATYYAPPVDEYSYILNHQEVRQGKRKYKWNWVWSSETKKLIDVPEMQDNWFFKSPLQRVGHMVAGTGKTMGSVVGAANDMGADVRWLEMYELSRDNNKWKDAVPDKIALQAALNTVIVGKLDTAELSDMRRRLQELFTSNHDVIADVDDSFRQLRAVIEYSASLIVTTTILGSLLIAYCLVWVFYLRDTSSSGMLTLRRDFPSALHPAKFWQVVLDYGLISCTQSVLGILFYKGDRHAKMSLFGITTTPNRMTWFGLLMLVLYPFAFIVMSGLKLLGMKSNVWSRFFQQYHSDSCETLKARKRYLDWLPIIRRFCHLEVSEIAPAGFAGARLTFANDVTDPSAPFMEGNVKNAENTLEQSGEMGSDEQNRFSSLADPSVSYDHREGLANVYVDEALYQPGFASRNVDIARRHPDATVGHTAFKFNNPYDSPLEVRSEVQLRHLNLLLAREGNDLLVPRENLELPSDEQTVLLQKNNRGNRLFWLLDRLEMTVALIGLTAMQRHSGTTVEWLFGLYCCLIGTSNLPMALSTANSKWHREMEAEKRSVENDETYAAITRNKLRVWPFRRRDALEGYQRVAAFQDDLGGLDKTLHSYVKTPIEEATRHSFWKTRCWFTIREVLTGPAMSELLKAWTLALLAFGHFRHLWVSAGAVSIQAQLTTVLALLLLDMESIREVGKDIVYCSKEIKRKSLHSLINFYDAVTLGDPGKRLAQRLTAAVAKCRGRKGVPDEFTGFGGDRTREFVINDVTVVNEEMGLCMPGKITPSPVVKREIRESPGFEKGRHKLQKVLYKAGPIGRSEASLFRSMPVRLPFEHFYYRGDDSLLPAAAASRAVSKPLRLAGTVQIKNHSGTRAQPLTDHPEEDDSFLSLYCDPALMPEYGRLRGKHQGHGFSVRYLAETKQLMIRGPRLEPGIRYEISSLKSHPGPEIPDDAPSELSSQSYVRPHGRGGTASAHCLCEETGVLRVPVGAGEQPDLTKEITLEVAGEHRGVVDPNIVQVDYYEFNKLDVQTSRSTGQPCYGIVREMYVPTQWAFAGPSDYRVTWHVQEPTQALETTGDALNGVIYLEMPKKSAAPNLDLPIEFKDRSENGFVVDPRDTDAHQFFLPQPKLNGLSGTVAWTVSQVNNFITSIVGKAIQEEVLEDPIPCTVVQCVDPKQRIYRVDPNFAVAKKNVESRLEVLRALRDEAETVRLATVWRHVMSTAEFVKFWRRYGIIGEVGSFVNPLSHTGANHYSTVKNQKSLPVAEKEFYRLVIEKIKRKMKAYDNLRERYEKWRQAYNDPDLYEAQLAYDRALWNTPDAELLKPLTQSLRRRKEQYERKLPDFVYPMDVPAHCISKKDKFHLQLREWQQQINDWLVDSENATAEDDSGGEPCRDVVARDVLRALTLARGRHDSPNEEIYRPVVHYVVGSRHVRGKTTEWRPDPLGAIPAKVRLVLPRDDTDLDVADFQNGETWMYCFLRLSASKLIMYFPNKEDALQAFRAGVSSTGKERNGVTGFWVPLEAFDKVKLVKESAYMSRLVFYSGVLQPVPPDLVFQTFDDSPCSAVYVENGQCRMIRLSHIVSSSDSTEYHLMDQMEIDADHTNVFPLTFKFENFYYDRWKSAVLGARMHELRKVAGSLDLESYEGSSSTHASSEPEYADKEGKPLSTSASSDVSSELTSSTSSLSSETSSESRVSESSRSISAITSSVHSTVETPPEEPEQAPSIRSELKEEPEKPPEPKRAPKTRFQNYQYGGYATREADKKSLYHHPHGEVYRGEFAAGKRDGPGILKYTDSEGFGWKFDGRLMNDDILVGDLWLDDPEELDRLRKSKDPRDKRRVVLYENFLLKPSDCYADTAKRGLSKMQSFPKHVEGGGPALNPEELRRFFEEDRRVHVDSLPTGDHDSKALLVMDVRKTVSGSGDPAVLGLSMASARKEEGRDVDLDSDHALIPARLRGSRALDPTLGYHGFDPAQGMECWNSKRFAKGTLVFADGSRFTGHRAGDKLQGVFTCPDCELYYRGDWNKHAPNGRGFMAVKRKGAKDRCLYRGSFADGQRHGHGVLKANDGQLCAEGTFENDHFRGKSCKVEVYDSHAPIRRYIGGLNEGLFEGDGHLVAKNGDYYKGQFQNGKRNGIGTLYSSDGTPLLVGSWSDDLPNGRVTRYVVDEKKGLVYSGYLQKGKRHGMGELTRNWGEVYYEGLWNGDNAHGRGTLYGEDGKYEGAFSMGKRSGLGRIVFKNVDGKRQIYEGDWKDDYPHGMGVYVDELYESPPALFSKGKVEKKQKSGVLRNIPDQLPHVQSTLELATPDEWRLNPETYRQLFRAGEGMWQHHLDHEFVHRDAMKERDDERHHTESSKSLKSKLSSSISEHLMRREEPILLQVVRGENLRAAPGFDGHAVPSPFCKVVYGEEERSTKPINMGGFAPDWSQTFTFHYNGTPTFQFQVFDCDTTHQWPVLGFGKFDIRQILNAGGRQGTFSVPLRRHDFATNSTAHEAGFVVIKVQLGEGGRDVSQDIPPARPQVKDAPKLVITVHSGNKLKKGDHYVKLELSAEKQKNTTIRKRGKATQDFMNEDVVFDYGGEPQLKLTLMDDLRKGMLGSAKVDLSFLEEGVDGLKKDILLTNKKGKQAGSLAVSFRFVQPL